jgi:dTDP-4-dehydrorhamnose reductase
MRVLVLGAGGMAGHVVSLYLREQGYLVDTLSARTRLDKNTLIVDALKLDKLKLVLQSKTHDIVINCIGLLVKQSDERKDLATYLNAFFPRFLEHYYRNCNTRIIHLSTDCVFSGKHPPYSETSTYDGTLFYDRTKAMGEIVNAKDLTLRMSIVGPDMHAHGTGLFNWFYQQTGVIPGYTDAIWTGITTIELAKGIRSAIDQGLTGLYHLVPNISISKCDLLGLFRTVFNRTDIEIRPQRGVGLDKTLVNSRQDFDHAVPDYPVMVEQMKKWIVSHSDLYKHYQ